MPAAAQSTPASLSLTFMKIALPLLAVTLSITCLESLEEPGVAGSCTGGSAERAPPGWNGRAKAAAAATSTRSRLAWNVPIIILISPGATDVAEFAPASLLRQPGGLVGVVVQMVRATGRSWPAAAGPVSVCELVLSTHCCRWQAAAFGCFNGLRECAPRGTLNLGFEVQNECRLMITLG